MIRVHITGDTHGEISRFCDANMPGESTWTKEDYLIICGDFGFIFSNDEAERRTLDTLGKKRYTICFLDGNHECFPEIFKFPEERFCGGKVHRIRENILHLMRGQVYTIEGKTYFIMGGAYSVDRYMRKLGRSYWNEEIPSDAELDEAAVNLKQYAYHVDYILSHTAPREMIRRLGYTPDPRDMQLTGFLEWIMYEVEHKHYYCGHWHVDRDMNDKFSFLWFGVKTIE